MPRAFLCVSIDCECDKGPGWRAQYPLRFHGVHSGIGERLQPLFAALGGKPTYLLSSEVLRDSASAERLATLVGCELGTHLHGEFAEPDATEPVVTRAVQREYPRSLEQAKLESLTASFRNSFRRAPLSFRAGRFGIGASTVPILERLGYAVESSVTPDVDWTHVSPGLTFAGAPTQPYHPNPADPARRGTSSLLEVPVTIVRRRLSRLPLVGRFVEPRWLRPTKTDGVALVRTARDAISSALRESPRAPVVLNAMFHNVEVVAGASPYALTESDAGRILHRIHALVDWARSEGIARIGLADVPEALGSA